MWEEWPDDGLTWWPARRARGVAKANHVGGVRGVEHALIDWACQKYENGIPFLRARARLIELKEVDSVAHPPPTYWAAVPQYFWTGRPSSDTARRKPDDWGAGTFEGRVFHHPQTRDQAWMKLVGVEFCADDLCDLIGIPVPTFGQPAGLSAEAASQPLEIPAEQALREVAEAVNSRGEASEILLDALRGGQLTAHGTANGLTDLAGAGKRRRRIDPEFWRTASEADQGRWSWSSGAFALARRGPLPVGVHGEYSDVSFSAPELLELLERYKRREALTPPIEMPEPVSLDRPARGRRRDQSRWDDLTIILLKMLHEGQMDTPGSVTELRKLVLDKLDALPGSSLAEDTIKSLIRRVWHEVLERH